MRTSSFKSLRLIWVAVGSKRKENWVDLRLKARMRLLSESRSCGSRSLEREWSAVGVRVKENKEVKRGLKRARDWES